MALRQQKEKSMDDENSASATEGEGIGVHADLDQYEFMEGMMAAMEDGIDEEEIEGYARKTVDESPTFPEDEEVFHEALEGPPQAHELNEDEHDFDEDEEEYAIGMMAAMEDGSEQEADHEQDQQEQSNDVETIINDASASAFASFGQTILHSCSSLTSAVREYYRMSQNDQLQVWDDLTGYQGQKRVFVEGKELPGYSEQFEPRHIVEAALKQLPQELQRMPASEPHAALDLAIQKHPKFVLARSFMLKFLRAEKFDVFATASRMCRHFEIKRELFEEEKLGREILLEDLDEDDMNALKSAYIQVLQNKDQGNRPVIFYYKAVSSECYKERENILRAYWYMANKLGQSEEVQKLGVSNIVYNVGGFPRQGMDYEKSRRLSHAFKSVPVRYNNFYVCLDDTPWLTVVETFAVMITRFLRVRLRMIRGTHEEVLHKLKAVGVPVQALPVNPASELLREAHLEWIERLRESETSGIRLNQAKPSGPDVVEDCYEGYMQMAQQISDSAASACGRGPRRRVDVVHAEQDAL